MKNNLACILIFLTANLFVIPGFCVPNFNGRGLISISENKSIDCSKSYLFSNAQYRSTKSIFVTPHLKMADLIYFFSTENLPLKISSVYLPMQNLNYPEISAILSYTAGGYEIINPPLWQMNVKRIEELSLPIKVLCSALSKFANFSGEVYRGGNVIGEFETLEKGDIYTNHAFMSTSIYPVPVYLTRPLQLKIVSKQGKKVEALSNYQNNPIMNEREVLFIPETKFLIIDKEIITVANGNKQYQITMEELVPEEQGLPAGVEHNDARNQEAAPIPTQLTHIEGAVTAPPKWYLTNERSSKNSAEDECETQKSANDIQGPCYIKCFKLKSGVNCQWKSSDWYERDPFEHSEEMNKIFQSN